GIRKVLGSSGWSILVLFLKEFGLLILISIVIAAPVSWLLLEQWLDTFFYRINQGASPYLIAAAIAITITIVTVSYHTFIASRKNPVDAIRTE
ncbi:MAG: ABC transporter permease, partial [Bacteroidota bacterium]